MVNDPALIVTRDGPTCTMVINNPAKRNALTSECYLEMAGAFEELSKEENVNVVVIRGAGDAAFSAGADIMGMPTRNGPKVERPRGDVGMALGAIRRHPFPVIAMLNGYTLGAGCILAMTCDIRIAGESVQMGIPTSRMGLVSNHESLMRFVSVLGYATTLEIFLTGRFYKAQECLEMGLVNHLVETDQLESYTYEMAGELAANAPLAMKYTKSILNRIVDQPELKDEDLERFREMAVAALKSDDHEEAKLAFRERRKPIFKGR
ncbi:MAG: enoyl-CoA hydratase-related protein [Candidatus Adiutricales bacterium]